MEYYLTNDFWHSAKKRCGHFEKDYPFEEIAHFTTSGCVSQAETRCFVMYDSEEKYFFLETVEPATLPQGFQHFSIPQLELMLAFLKERVNQETRNDAFEKALQESALN